MSNPTLEQLVIIAEKNKSQKQDKQKQIELEIWESNSPIIITAPKEEERVCNNCIEDCVASII